ncbi:glucokinase [Rubidibacter lacunae KORDI 51-2]|uniref:Glucokinase n=1 Tax=Rubidibacter lacunae KORDI 51-2 TaxID=582515 RepID=U5DR75_9CHRO|nr:glucokinase [Rubidibacter lacunae]ERN42195.1 glucokinase [Rubidibacter lacunae KORDI 51-2]
MTRLIAGDIGGTKTILRTIKATAGSSTYTTIAEATFPSQQYPDLVPMVREFQADAEQPLPETACFAIAGPVVNQTSQLTNIDWRLQSDRLARELGIARVRLLNDFAAVSYGILNLADEDRVTLLDAPVQRAPIGVLGAGTGLGEGFLVPEANGGFEVFATEGGHADFAPRNELEFALSEHIRKTNHIERVSVERVVSGQGIVSIYRFLRDVQFAPESPHVCEIIKAWERQEPTEDPAATISQAAAGEADRLCAKTMEMFVEAYAAEAGNLALKFLPYGGLYIAGGIAAKILPLLQSDRFERVFKSKGRVSPILNAVPVHVILNPQVGLLGSVQYALK